MSGDGREELRARVRSAAPLDPDWAVVIRGGPDTPALLRSHARRLHRLYVLDGEPTFGHPHLTVLMPNLEAVDELAAAFGELLVNPYADEWKEER